MNAVVETLPFEPAPAAGDEQSAEGLMPLLIPARPLGADTAIEPEAGGAARRPAHLSSAL